jgi:pyruvate/2-oxoglutarate dehydrogenase complex dihydrolipoamide dehydrogenase (E3) component
VPLCGATASSWSSGPAKVTRASRDGDDEAAEWVLTLRGGRQLRVGKLLVATGRRPRVDGVGLKTVGIEPDPHGVPVDERLRVADGLWAVGDITGIWPLTHVGECQGAVLAANILGELNSSDLGGREDRDVLLRPLRANGFLTLLSDRDGLTGAYALRPEAGEWLQQARLAIGARVPLDILADTIHPFPTLSEIYLEGVKEMRRTIAGSAAR